MRRNTAGRYRVGAKNEKQVRQLLQKAIDFGSIVISHQDNDDISTLIPMGEIRREIYDREIEKFVQIMPRHACDPR